MLAAVSGYRRGTNFGVSRTSTGYGDLQFFSWTHWSLHHCAFGEEPAIAGDVFPIRVYHNGIPDDVIILNSENVWRAHREPVDSRSPRLNGPGPSDSITWSLPKDSVSGGRMAQAPCLPHGLFSGPVLAAVAASVPLPFPTALRNSSTASTRGDFKPSSAIYLHTGAFSKGYRNPPP